MTARAVGWLSPALNRAGTLKVAEARPEAGSAEALEYADDRTLVEACLAGRPEAFDRLVERHRRAVYQLCYRFVGNHEDASDLAQEVFLRAYRALGRFQGRSSFGTWLYRIGVNACLDRVSDRRLVHEPLDTVREADVARRDDPVDKLIQAEEAARIRAAIAQLPPKQRATLILRVYRGLPHEEIARILGSSVGAAKANLFHALANLKKVLAQGS